MQTTIRHAEQDDYAAIAHIYAQPLAAAGTMQIPLQSREVWKQRLAGMATHDRMLVAVVQGEVVGNLGLHPVPNPRRAHVAGIGMAVRDDLHGRGIGTALLKAAIDLADNWLNLLRLELTVYADNTAAQRLYQNHGFVLEGTHRAYALRHGQYVDTHAMARLHPAPPGVR
ncbi:MAG: GNAT family N-acetyltransferase [Rhodoferax sp.]|uniref:GNAT family N-acetyltransferase n=1 Tax=Rhodoferax sp. TaxID=50421 RepID=UPI0032668EB3